MNAGDETMTPTQLVTVLVIIFLTWWGLAHLMRDVTYWLRPGYEVTTPFVYLLISGITIIVVVHLVFTPKK